ncbi:putative nuclear matrix constituent protein 1-like protein-like, partial [Planoprotostelium fungivorum]
MNPLRSSTPLAHSASEIHFRRPYHHEPYMHYSPNGMSSKLMDSVTEQVLRPELDRKTSLPVMRSASSAGGEPSAMTKNQSHPSKRHSTYLWKSVMTPVQLVSVRQGKQEVCSEILMVANTDIPLKDLREFLASSLGGNADQIETLECSSGSWNEDTVWIGIPDSRTLWKQLAGGIKCYRVKWKDTSDAPTWGSSRENHGLSRVPSRSVPSTPLMMESSEDEEVPEMSVNTSAEEDIEREQKIRRKHQRMLINQLGARTDPRDQMWERNFHENSDEESSSESSDDEVDYNDMRDERQLNVVLERERNNYSKIIHREKISAENLAKTKDTMRSLIVRISHYKAMLEQDKESLSRKFADLEKIRQDIMSQNATLRNEKSEVMVDLRENRDELQDYQDQHDEIVQKERDDIQTIKRQDTAALMTYMKDIEELEEMNEMLTKEDESYHTKIRVIRSKHAKILADYISEKEKSEFIKKKSEGISQINDSLVQQIRRFQSEPMTMESRRAIQHVTEEAEAAITKILDTSTENEENDHRSHRTDISESIGRRVSVVDDDLQREAMFILKSSATSEGGNVMESYVTVSCLDPQQGEKAQVRCMTALDDIIWTGYSDGCIRLYHMETGELLEERRGHTASILDIKAIRQDSVWTSSKDKTICIWSPQKHQALKKLATTICNSMAEVESEVWASGID